MQFDLNFVKTIIAGFPHDLRRHSCNVCYLAVRLAEYTGCTYEQLKTLTVGALLHDIGKSCIDENILNKPGKLSDYEFSIVKQHTVWGAKMLDQFKESQEILPIILYHHERWDGKGYEGLCGQEIPELASIVTIADAFDAMTSSRPYQKPKTLTDALKELNNNKGTQFSPELVEKFELCILELAKRPYQTSINKFMGQLINKFG